MKKIISLICLFLLFSSTITNVFSAGQNKTGIISMDKTNNISIKKDSFGKLSDGRAADLYTLANINGMTVKITNYGGALTEICVPDKNGCIEDVILGYDNVSGYENDNCYFGYLIGRYANRIGKAKFWLDGTEFQLSVNDGANLLHGGKQGFHKMLWNAEPEQDEKSVSLLLTYFSKDGEMGFPGNLNVTVIYTLTNNNELQIEYSAATDKPTVVNLTNHAYFNLAGAGKRDILDHLMMINADLFTPTDKTLIPTGEFRKVVNTAFDFTKPEKIGARINSEDEQLKIAGGYDHNWVLNKKDKGMSLAAKVVEPESGRTLEILTTEPGIQFYAGNFLDGTVKGKKETVYKHRYGFCLETQHYPDSPNKPEFPTVKLNPGQTYSTKTIYKFSIIE